ncbi:hypothetical protein MMC09_002917 [Bachmanniomyces sp. S44760]|nr:hypothetical protein [Bachmanniomyces sp. S44760]
MRCYIAVAVLVTVGQLRHSIAAPLRSTHQVILNNENATPDSVRSALKRSEIIPTVLDDFEPKFLLKLSYPDKGDVVDLGNTLLPSDTTSAPTLQVHTLSAIPSLSPTATLASNVTYTIALTDPDATSRSNPSMAEMCHWLITGVTLTSHRSSSSLGFGAAYSIDLNPSTGDPNLEVLVEYLPPSPPPKTAFHRYVFVLLAPASSENSQLRKPNERPHWGYGKVGKGVRQWSEDNDQIVVGANFFYAQNKEQ